MPLNPILAYGEWLAGASRTWPDAALEVAHRQIVDLAGVAVRGATEASARVAFDTVRNWGGGTAAVIGMDASLAAPWAAFVNGTAAHALDFDDNFEPAKAHASAVLVPAILALADQERLSGAACLDAYIAGLQIMGRAGEGLNPVHRHRGWHATATIGALGAAAACARLLRLNAEQCGHALSISTSMSGGFMSQFGTMMKPVHAGLGAKAGVMAASLARQGLAAGSATLDGARGMSRLMVGPDLEQLREQLQSTGSQATLRFRTEAVGEPLFILSHGLKVKRFPNCASAHRAMDGLLALKDEHGFSADDISELIVRGPQSHFDNLMHVDPSNALEAKFSLQFALALLLLEGECGLAHFNLETVQREDIRRIYPRIRHEPVANVDIDFPTEVAVVLRDGRRIETRVAAAFGSRSAPFSWDQVWAKFRLCVSEVVSEELAERLGNELKSLPQLKDVKSLTPLLAACSAPPARSH